MVGVRPDDAVVPKSRLIATHHINDLACFQGARRVDRIVSQHSQSVIGEVDGMRRLLILEAVYLSEESDFDLVRPPF
jgi:hypothetical protein